MSDAPSPSSPPPPARSPIGGAGTAAAARPRLNPLAVSAFVVSLTGFCPLMGLPAIVLGFVAHLQISRRPDRTRGRGFALWAIAIGSASSIAWLSLWNHVGTRMLDVLSGRMEVALTTALDAAVDGDPDGVEMVLDGPAVDRDDIDALLGDVRSAGLVPDRISIVRFDETETGMTPRIVAAIRVRDVDGVRWTGEAAFRLRPPPYRGLSLEDLAAEPRLCSLWLFGPDGRSIRYRHGERDAAGPTSEGPSSESPAAASPPEDRTAADGGSP